MKFMSQILCYFIIFLLLELLELLFNIFIIISLSRIVLLFLQRDYKLWRHLFSIFISTKNLINGLWFFVTVLYCIYIVICKYLLLSTGVNAESTWDTVFYSLLMITVILIIWFTTPLLCARCYANHFMWTLSFNSHNKLVNLAPLLSLLHNRHNWGLRGVR